MVNSSPVKREVNRSKVWSFVWFFIAAVGIFGLYIFVFNMDLSTLSLSQEVVKTNFKAVNTNR